MKNAEHLDIYVIFLLQYKKILAYKHLRELSHRYYPEDLIKN